MILIEYAPSFERIFKKLPKALKEEIIEKIDLFADPKNHERMRVHKLHGQLKGFYSFSVNFKYRIVFSWASKTHATILTVGDHSVYE